MTIVVLYGMGALGVFWGLLRIKGSSPIRLSPLRIQQWFGEISVT